MRIVADTGVCVGEGQCVLTDPGVFDQDDDGIVTLLTDRPEGGAADRAGNAVALCPTSASSIIED
ncbi:(4Fe-4S)-binding protein [Actinoplanes sp. NBRC 103695]|uniref:ferredoxin n=1 Tax=Actinoplanes sp. NBRC 103695 TaxID=3032202 RepID=UPI0024A2F663|nr:(4Fe-4S)-binding protein [Actinoplanes sp. NBRC 103695]GLZ01795.1 ferredoxin [Actinoplanes sp. NBRC 103695]